MVGGPAADLALVEIRVLEARHQRLPLGVAEDEVAGAAVVVVDRLLDQPHAEDVPVEGKRALQVGYEERDVVESP